MFCKRATAVYQQTPGHVSYQRREEGKLEEVKSTAVCLSCNAL